MAEITMPRSDIDVKVPSGYMPIVLGEYGPKPGDLEIGRTYAIDGVAGTERPCLSLAGLATAIAMDEPELHPWARVDRVIALSDAVVKYEGFETEGCGACNDTIPHHIFSPVEEPLGDGGVPILYFTLDGMFALSETQPDDIAA